MQSPVEISVSFCQNTRATWHWNKRTRSAKQQCVIRRYCKRISSTGASASHLKYYSVAFHRAKCLRCYSTEYALIFDSHQIRGSVNDLPQISPVLIPVFYRICYVFDSSKQIDLDSNRSARVLKKSQLQPGSVLGEILSLLLLCHRIPKVSVPYTGIWLLGFCWLRIKIHSLTSWRVTELINFHHPAWKLHVFSCTNLGKKHRIQLQQASLFVS